MAKNFYQEYLLKLSEQYASVYNSACEGRKEKLDDIRRDITSTVMQMNGYGLNDSVYGKEK